MEGMAREILPTDIHHAYEIVVKKNTETTRSFPGTVGSSHRTHWVPSLVGQLAHTSQASREGSGYAENVRNV